MFAVDLVMIKTWPLQDAKNRLSEVVENALHQGHQIITRRGEPAVVVVAFKEFKKLFRKENKLTDFLSKSPLKESNLEIDRPKDYPREVEF